MVAARVYRNEAGSVTFYPDDVLGTYGASGYALMRVILHKYRHTTIAGAALFFSMGMQVLARGDMGFVPAKGMLLTSKVR